VVVVVVVVLVVVVVVVIIIIIIIIIQRLDTNQYKAQGFQPQVLKQHFSSLCGTVTG
jgi:hypothetical protein